jgi:hypothetical protein
MAQLKCVVFFFIRQEQMLQLLVFNPVFNVDSNAESVILVASVFCYSKKERKTQLL